MDELATAKQERAPLNIPTLPGDHKNGIRADAVAAALCSTAGNLVGLNMNPEGHETFLQMAIDAMRGDIKTGAALATAIDLEQGTVRPYSGIVTN